MSKLQDPVLVVDDEADIRDLMEMTLMKMGLRVQTAVGVEDAKDKLDNNDYSLVLTDMRMPDGSGLEVVQYIDELMLDTPVAVITAFGNADQAVEALNAGAFDYLQKPITLYIPRSTPLVEGSQCQLCTWFPDRLRCDNSHSFTHVNHLTSCQVSTITSRTDTFFSLTA